MFCPLTEETFPKSGCAWEPEGQGEAGVVAEARDVLPKHRRHQGRQEGAGVDGKVEEGEVGLELALLLRQLELVGPEGRDARLDTACGAPRASSLPRAQWRQNFVLIRHPRPLKVAFFGNLSVSGVFGREASSTQLLIAY